MVVDSSQVLYFCPVCEDAFREQQKVKNHISAMQSGGHSGKSGYELDRPIPSREPTAEPIDVEVWRESIRAWLDDHPKRAEIDYKTLAGEMGPPSPFVSYSLRYDFDRTPVNTDGTESGVNVISKWDDLTDKQQNTLLAVAYFPDRTHEEIAEMSMSGHGSQSQVSTTVRKYFWVFSIPDFDAPITLEPDEREPDNGGEVNYEGEDVALAGLDEELEELEEELEAEMEDESPESGLRIDEDLAYRAMVAAVETRDYDTAEDLWRTALDK